MVALWRLQEIYMRKRDCDDDNYDDETIMTPGRLKGGHSRDRKWFNKKVPHKKFKKVLNY